MALDGVNAACKAVAANDLNAACKNTGASLSGAGFGSLLADALSDQGSGVFGKASYGSPYPYIGKLVQNTDSPGAVMAALIGAGSADFSQIALLGVFGALLGGEAGFAGAGAPSFGNNRQSVPGALTAPPCVPVSPGITGDSSIRTPERYACVINQFGVETNPRYAVNQKGRGDTYCNIFVWDVTSAMNAEIPHYYNAKTGEPMKRGDENASEMNANAMFDWLKEHGGEYGWREVTAGEAQNLANSGRPVVTALKRPGAHGHVQVVRPSKDGAFNGEKGVTVAQAGSNLTNCSYISDLLGSSSLSKVSYFAHI